MVDPAAVRRAHESGVALYERGDLAAAEQHFAEATRLAPEGADAYNALGIVVAGQGRVPEALEHFRTAARLDPRSVAAVANLADAALNLGRMEEARAALEAGLALAPGDVNLNALLAETLAALGLVREALARAARWAALAPGEAQAHRAHGTLACRIAAYDAALAAFRRARTLDAGGTDERLDLHGIAACLEFARFEARDEQAEGELLECLQVDGVESQTLARAAADLLCVAFEIGPAPPPHGLERWTAAGWVDSALLRALLERTINVDARLERVLVGQRAVLAETFSSTGALPDGWRRLGAAIATQCFLNEYAWPMTPAEETRAAANRKRLDALVTAGASSVPVDLAIVTAMYACLARLPSAPDLGGALAWPPALGPLLERSLAEPLAEAGIAAEIPRSTIADRTSRAVRDQYEESPYPRWVDLPEPNSDPLVHQLGDLFPAFRPTAALDGPQRILIAGCGSGRHPLRVARGDPGAEIVAIDLSVASLAYAARRARELGVDNVEFRQLDILDVRHLTGDFSVIESSGVIHHMRSPAAGLRALSAKLRPGGVMKLGLYSRRARRVITLARERVAELGFDPTPRSMREFRARVLAGDVEGLEALADSSDLYTLSACRDLVFHVQEHQFSPPEIGALLDAGGLVFLGFQLPDHASLEAYRTRFPDDAARTDLERWDQFEEDRPGTFANTFQLWCQKPA